jgi:hypothetical protein
LRRICQHLPLCLFLLPLDLRLAGGIVCLLLPTLLIGLTLHIRLNAFLLLLLPTGIRFILAPLFIQLALIDFLLLSFGVLLC